MSPRASLVALLAFLFALPAHAQEAPADDAVESYLRERGLEEPLGAHLRLRLDASAPEDRPPIAERLGKLYVDALGEASNADERERVQVLAQELLRRVPEARTYELRINLAKASYLNAEQVAEQSRMRLASEAEVAEAERVLRSVTPRFREIASKSHRRVELLERREMRGDEDEDELRAQLEDARRVRSLAMYYAGWSNYYLALLTGEHKRAGDALQSFGWILGAKDGKEASVDHVPVQLLRYDHVAKAAIGAALCETLSGQDVRAVRWLDEIEGAPELSGSVRERLFTWRIVVLATSRRWADLLQAIDGRRVEDGEPRLSLAEARLLAVLTLEALDAPDSWSGREDLAGHLAQLAINELVVQGEINHVLDLVVRYGTAPIGDEGFVVRYVRGLLAYRRAREAQAAAGDDPDEPSTSNPVVVEFRAVAEALGGAMIAEDADRFPDQRARAGILLGLSLYYAGDLIEASDRLASAYAHAEGAQREEALWYAVVAASAAVERGEESFADRLDELATLYIGAYPDTDRAAKLLLQRATRGVVSARKAAEVLLGVEPDSPVYEAARRQAANLLYKAYTSSRGADRDWAASRFVSISGEVIALDAQKLDAGDREAAARIVNRARQVLDAALGAETPDASAGLRMLAIIEETAGESGIDLTPFSGELAYRRLQIAIARSDENSVEEALDELRRVGGRFAESGDRLLFRRALRAWEESPDDPAAARAVVAHGTRVLDRMDTDDPALPSLTDTVAGAGAEVWRLTKDPSVRDAAIALDERMIEIGNATPKSLRRLATLLESAGRTDESLDAWRRVLNGTEEGSETWYEAKYHSLRLIATTDPARARTVMDQHKLLVDGYGPEPWGEKLRELDALLPGGSP